MCLIVFSWQPDAATPLIVLANRDEFFERAAEPLHWWTDRPDVLAGRDLRGGGTWMGVNRAGRFAALTNFRDGRAPMTPKDSPSRGLLVSAMLDATSFDDDLARVEKHAHEYAGFNLLAGDLPAGKLYSLGNRETLTGDEQTAKRTGGQTSLPVAHAIVPGFHGLSNALLDTPWPKLVSRRNALRDALENGADDIALMQVMRDAAEADDESLPETGVTRDWEKKLSAAFIASPAYGTRCTTLLRYHRDGVIEVTESTVSPSQPASELRDLQHYRFDVNHA
ncbi:NRDE family protein [Pandoraea anapnoica]|uniref:NRDE family protein n=1 Tax=Pandoraea anapnoica TaxID=2508301 RepID=A0A5E4ZNP4_9BURK|nr:NRDE family protein [Pandoraea anapnoica]VVE62307.1 NRDE family protein [Pandoraea anapnoica]